MITVSDQDKYICVWGKPAHVDLNTISTYRDQGYTIVRLSNGTGNIKECIKAIVESNDII